MDKRLKLHLDFGLYWGFDNIRYKADMSVDLKVGSMIPEDLSTKCSIGSMI